jgi:hypothetical protein
MATSSFDNASPALQRALDALISGETARPDDIAELTGEEKAELLGLARTARLTHLTLAHPEPTQELEAEALARAQKHLAQVGPRPVSVEPEKAAPTLAERLRGFFKAR